MLNHILVARIGVKVPGFYSQFPTFSVIFLCAGQVRVLQLDGLKDPNFAFLEP